MRNAKKCENRYWPFWPLFVLTPSRRAARAVVGDSRRRPSVDGAAREAAFVVVAWNLALCVRMEPLLALLIARCAQFVAPTRSTVIQPMATKALVSTPAAAGWFRAAGDSAQWMLPAAAS